MDDITQIRRRQASLQDAVDKLKKPPPNGAVSLVGTIGSSPPSGVVFVPVILTEVSGPIVPVAGNTGTYTTSYDGFALNVTGGSVSEGDRVLITQIDGIFCFEA